MTAEQRLAAALNRADDLNPGVMAMTAGSGSPRRPTQGHRGREAMSLPPIEDAVCPSSAKNAGHRYHGIVVHDRAANRTTLVLYCRRCSHVVKP